MPTTPVTDLPAAQLTPGHLVPPQVDVEKLLAAVSDADVTSARSPGPTGMHFAETTEEGIDWMASWAGLLLIVLGVVAILSSNHVLRKACAVSLLRGRWARGLHQPVNDADPELIRG